MPTAAVLALAFLAACGPSPADAPAPLAPADTLDRHPSDGGAVAHPDAAALAADSLWARALGLHYDAVVVDGHVDTPTAMLDAGYALGERHTSAHVDLPRMVEGGLDAAFFSVWVSRHYGEGERATDRALALVDAVQRQAAGLDGAVVVRTADGVLRARERGQVAILLGLEGGHALQGSPDVLRQLAANGVRYVTLTHANTNAFADAATDAPRWGGLNDTGRALVAEMNRLGVLVDLSHASDSTFFDAVAASRAPVILSHSSARALFDHPRNASDAMLRALAANDGVALVNFFADYLGPDPSLDTVLDHIEHMARVAGPAHVGLGSDFDGVPRLPRGLGDATRLPWITHGLLARGFSEAEVRGILGGNVLRVLRDAEAVAAAMR